MNKIRIEITGVAVELVLGNYMPTDSTIINNWEQFYHYNDIIHVSQLLSNHLQTLHIYLDEKLIISKQLPTLQEIKEKSFCPTLINDALYLRTECAENAVFCCEANVQTFDTTDLKVLTQDYDGLFKTGNSFITSISLKNNILTPVWQSGNPIGNLCVVCKHENGFLLPVYDAIRKVKA